EIALVHRPERSKRYHLGLVMRPNYDTACRQRRKSGLDPDSMSSREGDVSDSDVSRGSEPAGTRGCASPWSRIIKLGKSCPRWQAHHTAQRGPVAWEVERDGGPIDARAPAGSAVQSIEGLVQLEPHVRRNRGPPGREYQGRRNENSHR